MTTDEIMAEVEEAFSGVPRPKMFICGTCACEECLGHEATMQAFPPDNLPLNKLGNPGWDPICFASAEALAYFMPGLVRIVLQHTQDYLQQFLFHLEARDRIAMFSRNQTQALCHLLDHLTLECADNLDTNLAVDELFRTREKLEEHLRHVRK